VCARARVRVRVDFLFLIPSVIDLSDYWPVNVHIIIIIIIIIIT